MILKKCYLLFQVNIDRVAILTASVWTQCNYKEIFVGMCSEITNLAIPTVFVILYKKNRIIHLKNVLEYRYLGLLGPSQERATWTQIKNFKSIRNLHMYYFTS